MEELFQNIIETEYIEEVFDELDNKPMQDYTAIFIAAMAYYNFIEISQEFSAKLYINILNTSLKNTDDLLENIFKFLMDKHISNLEAEINDKQ